MIWRHRRSLVLLLASGACAGGGADAASRRRDSVVAATDAIPVAAPSPLARSPGVSRDGAAAPSVADSRDDPIAPAAPPEDRPSPPTTAEESPTSSRTTPRRPFAVGERLNYEVRFGSIRVGSATMELRGIEEVRGVPAYHAVFRVQGGNALYRVDDHYESWFSTATLASLRYEQNIDEGSYERRRRFDIHPERRVFRESGKPAEEPSVSEPLDDASFLYFLRTVPLEVSRSYAFDRYFRPDRNPVTVRVVRRERVRVPAGAFDAIVVRPTIKTTGIFSEGGEAEVWFADDSTRRILQIRSRLRFGSLNLYLR